MRPPAGDSLRQRPRSDLNETKSLFDLCVERQRRFPWDRSRILRWAGTAATQFFRHIARCPLLTGPVRCDSPPSPKSTGTQNAPAQGSLKSFLRRFPRRHNFLFHRAVYQAAIVKASWQAAQARPEIPNCGSLANSSLGPAKKTKQSPRTSRLKRINQGSR